MMSEPAPVSQWEGSDLTELFLKTEVIDHKPRSTKGEGLRKAGTVMTVQSTEPISTVFEKLSKQGFLSAPVCSDSTLVGHITLLELVKYVNSLYYATTEEDWSDWFDKQLAFQTTPIAFFMKSGQDEYTRAAFPTMNRHFSSFSALEMMGRNEEHQILLMDEQDKLCGMITQSMLISFLRQGKSKWGPDFGSIKVSEFQKSPGKEQERPLQVVYEEELAINAFLKMEDEDVYGLPIVDDEGVLTGCISVRDLRGVGTDGSKFFRLFNNVRLYKDLTRSEHEFLAPSTHYSKARVPYGPIYVTPEDTMEDVITKMNDGNVHRIFICTSESHRRGAPVPVGVISQSDVLFNTLQYIVQSNGGAKQREPIQLRATQAARKQPAKFRAKVQEPTPRAGARTSPRKEPSEQKEAPQATRSSPRKGKREITIE